MSLDGEDDRKKIAFGRKTEIDTRNLRVVSTQVMYIVQHNTSIPIFDGNGNRTFFRFKV